jgi:hypothetical protein
MHVKRQLVRQLGIAQRQCLLCTQAAARTDDAVADAKQSVLRMRRLQKRGKAREVLGEFQSMKEAGVQPNIYMYNSLINSFSMLKDVAATKRYFQV